MTVMHPFTLPRAPLLAAPLLLSACMSLAPPHEAPALPVPATFDTTAADPAPLLPGGSGTSFVLDARLRTLLGLALADNRDLRVAVLAVERARAQYGIAQAERLPTVTAGASASRTRTADDLTAAGRGNTASQYSASIGLASWEIDFWGRVRVTVRQRAWLPRSEPPSLRGGRSCAAITGGTGARWDVSVAGPRSPACTPPGMGSSLPYKMAPCSSGSSMSPHGG